MYVLDIMVMTRPHTILEISDEKHDSNKEWPYIASAL